MCLSEIGILVLYVQLSRVPTTTKKPRVSHNLKSLAATSSLTFSALNFTCRLVSITRLMLRIFNLYSIVSYCFVFLIFLICVPYTYCNAVRVSMLRVTRANRQYGFNSPPPISILIFNGKYILYKKRPCFSFALSSFVLKYGIAFSGLPK